MWPGSCASGNVHGVIGWENSWKRLKGDYNNGVSKDTSVWWSRREGRGREGRSREGRRMIAKLLEKNQNQKILSTQDKRREMPVNFWGISMSHETTLPSPRFTSRPMSVWRKATDDLPKYNTTNPQDVIDATTPSCATLFYTRGIVSVNDKQVIQRVKLMIWEL